MTLAAITMTAPEAASPVQMYRATYSPDDNKLRLYAASRLDPETYKKVHDAGFRWAPRQALFVAPAWTPGREDVLLSLAGEIEAPLNVEPSHCNCLVSITNPVLTRPTAILIS